MEFLQTKTCANCATQWTGTDTPDTCPACDGAAIVNEPPVDAPADPPTPEMTVHRGATPDGAVHFDGDVPPDCALIGVLGAHRVGETLFVVDAPQARQQFIRFEGRRFTHVSEGPDGRWQYEDQG